MLLPDILYLAFLSLVVIYADFKMTRGNWGAKWNGIGAVPDILDGTAKIPMRHRVLVAWICRLVEICRIEQRPFLNTYVYLRWLAITLSLVVANWYFSALGLKPLLPVSILACVFVLSSLYLPPFFTAQRWSSAAKPAKRGLRRLKRFVMCSSGPSPSSVVRRQVPGHAGPAIHR